MSWWETLPTLGLAVVVFFAPGLALLWAAGVRGPSLAVLAVPVTATVAACAGIVFGYTHIPFNPVTIVALTVLLLVLVLVIRRLVDKYTLHSSALKLAPPARDYFTGHRINQLMIPLAVAIPAIIIAARYMSGFGSPEAFSETYDNVYHLNAVRYIADTQSANTLTLGNLTDASQGLYPAGMHAMLALVLMSGAQSITIAVNWGTILYAALVWPMGAIFLVSRIVGSRPATLLGAGVLSAGFSSFPYLMVAFGILYPNHAALTMLPVALGLAIEALGVRSGQLRINAHALILLVAIVPGLALTHPSALVALLAFASPAVLAVLLRAVVHFKRGQITRRAFVFWLAAAILYYLVTLIIWIKARPPASAATWPPFQNNAQALGEVLTSAPMGTTVAWIISFFTVVGLYAVARNFRRHWWTLLMFTIGAVLYLVVSAWPFGSFRFFMTGVWYSDSNRFAAMLPLITLPIVALGIEWTIRKLSPVWDNGMTWIADRAKSKESPLARLSKIRTGSPALGVGAIVAFAVLGVAAQGGTLAKVQEKLHTTFETRADSSLVTTDELTLMNQLGTLVPEGDVIVGNPRTGASMAYAFSGRKVIAPHIVGARSDSERLLMDHWAEAAYNPDVCPVIKEKRAYWALDFADSEMAPRGEPLEGTRDLASDSAPGMKLIKAVGKARLFKVTACG
ncbi:DUF6541 family protein [Pseudarthrobacter sp. J1763]|uniref:DUF6541 family protein n=1 Tax=Pseudarthrobacter sp. J1763 TaxID=3420445 RepID=UPI003D298A98